MRRSEIFDEGRRAFAGGSNSLGRNAVGEKAAQTLVAEARSEIVDA